MLCAALCCGAELRCACAALQWLGVASLRRCGTAASSSVLRCAALCCAVLHCAFKLSCAVLVLCLRCTDSEVKL